MEEKYLKDFVIVLVVILLIAFILKDASLYRKIEKVSDQSKYRKLALDDALLTKIKNLEKSIQDRKEFTFTVMKDPLEQNLIVRTMKDLQAQWRQKIENMVRLESTIIPEFGEKRAVIAYKGKTLVYKIGDKFVKGKITDIDNGKITYSFKGVVGTIEVEKLPEKPVEIQTTKINKKRQYNW